MNEKKYPVRVGDIRPSQLLHTFGIGAIVDLPNISVMVMGLDEWDTEKSYPIIEPRLLSAVQSQLGDTVKELKGPPTAPDSDIDATVGAPVSLFPRWLRCPQCNRLARSDSGFFQLRTDKHHPDRVRYVHTNCTKGRSPTVVPARFLTACPHGHLDEFPWIEFVHSGEICDAPRGLVLRDEGVSGQTTDIWVKCEGCGKQKQMSKAFGEMGRNEMPMCRGRNPHLRNFQEDPCGEQLQTLLLGASNSWFPLILSSLAIPVSADVIEQVVHDHWDVLNDLEDLNELKTLLKAYAKRGEHPQLTKLGAEKIWEGVERKRKDSDQAEGSMSYQDLKHPEWLLFSQPNDAPRTDDFQLRSSPVPPHYERYFDKIVLVERLREVKALVGFTRIYPPADFSETADTVQQVVSLTKGYSTWVPAAEVRGEGIFIQLREDAVTSWTQKDLVRVRENELMQGHKAWRTARKLDPPEKGFPGIRYTLIHSFSHALMRRLALECGYTAASIRERIYSADPESDDGPMAGVLLYTAAPDSEGTLGGLVSLGETHSMARNLDEALGAMQLCSSDPLCAEHQPNVGTGALHGASCHACLFASETSCERGNKYLDRSLLVDTVADKAINFFDSRK